MTYKGALPAPSEPVPKAIDRVIVYHAHCLHEGVADRRPDELEPSAQQVSAQGVGLRRPRRKLPQRSPAVHARRPANKAPHIGIETPELVLDRKEGLGVTHRAADLETVANNAGIPEETRDLCRPELGHPRRIEADECQAIGVAFLENRLPAEPSLRTFEYQKLEEEIVVVNGYTPLEIVIRDAEWGAGPGTARVLIHSLASVWMVG